MNERDIFDRAIALLDPTERSAYLDEAVGGDSRLKEHIEGLVEAHHKLGSFLDSPAVELETTLDQARAVERPGQVIGSYKLREQLGTGGFGVVWAAEQLEPVRRKVALKIIKPGMDTEDVVARFEAERQALALMDHPNIARVFDAGMTEHGRPFFVMELIRGVPITEYCDDNKLTVHQRLALFVEVCKAVQHAHQKGIIHRDVKPSNVLVTLHDGQPVPKVIDFGIAKALNQRLTDKTIYTRVHQAIGTLAYMSPEAAELSGLDMDTRADVYGLGVLLYELLTGTTPFDKRRLEEAALHEACRIIREEEPPKASTRLSTLGESATALSSQRSTDARDLAQLVHGDLDWILVRALEKDRTRRYESASAFAADVRRYLHNEAIEARPPSTAYRLRKAAARNRAALASAMAVILSLLLGIASTTWMAMESIRQRDVARSAEATLRKMIESLHEELTEKVILNAQSGDKEGTEAAMDLAERSGIPETTLNLLAGIVHYYEGDNESAIRVLEDVVELEPNNVTARAMFAISHGHDGGWMRYSREMLQVQEAAKGMKFKDYESLILGCALMYADTTQCVALLEDVVDRRPEWVVARAMLAGAKTHRAIELHNAALAEEARKEAELAREFLPNNCVVAIYNLWTYRVAVYFAQLRGEPYEHFAQEAQESIDLLLTHPDYTVGVYNVAAFYEGIGDDDRAIEVLSNAIGDADYDGWTYYYVGLLVRCGHFDKALNLLDAIEIQSAAARCAKVNLLSTIPKRRKDAELLRNSLFDDPDSPWAVSGAIESLCALGEPARVRSESKNRLENLRKHDLTSWLCAKSLAFQAGETTIDQFDEDCGEEPLGRVEFHYQVALQQLSEGDREGAIQHFDECVNLDVADSWDCEWAKAFRQLLADNPNWPEHNESVRQ